MSGTEGDAARRIGELVAAGRTIDAIKELREATGLGLAEAKQLIDAVARGRPLPPALVGKLAERQAANSAVADDIRELAATNRIEAIKLLRERAGLGLKEAKDLLDAAVPVAGGGKRGCLLPLLFGFVCAGAFVAMRAV